MLAHLHTHLESALRPATVRAFGGEPATGPFDGFRDFADRRAAVRALLRTPEQFRRIAAEFCADEAANGVRYAEVTFTAAAHGERVGDPGMPLAAVIDGLAEGRDRFGVETRLILDHSRRRPVERLRESLRLAAKHPQVVAVGLAGDEAYPAAPFADVFRAARDQGLHVVHHAGEIAGPDSIRDALAAGAERIGHGIRVLDDPDLVAELRERGIALEVCPTSNVLLGLVPSLGEHPLPRMVAAGLTVTLSTDGETGLAAEYALLDGWGVSAADLARNAVAASFAPTATKETLLGVI